MQSESGALNIDATSQPMCVATQSGRSELSLIPSLGGALTALKLWHSRLNKTMPSCVPEITSDDIAKGNPYYKGVLLYPFVNRLDGGRYQFNGHAYSFEVNEPSTETALHGFIFNRTPEIIINHRSSDLVVVSLVFDHGKSFAAYPFDGRLTVTYRLSDSEGLTVEFNVENTGEHAMPVALGWHPYFCLPGQLADWQLSLPKVKMVEINQRLLPTGELAQFEGFNQLHSLGEIRLDNCFALTQKNGTQSTKLWSPEIGAGLNIWQQAGESQLNYLQLCIPPTRDSIAIEPVSANIDALNNHQGLITLSPGETYRVSCGVACE